MNIAIKKNYFLVKFTVHILYIFKLSYKNITHQFKIVIVGFNGFTSILITMYVILNLKSLILQYVIIYVIFLDK